MTESDKESEGLTLGQVFGSVMAAFLGVQREEKRRRDLSKGKPSQFIVVGLVATALFVLTIVGVVTLVMKLAGV